MNREMLETLGYVINERRFSDVEAIIDASEDYVKLELEGSENTIIYTGAEDPSLDLSIKKPNITVVPNLACNKGIVAGTTFGHHQDMPGKKRMQEIYEFHSFGAMVLDHDGTPFIDMLVAEPGSIIKVPNNCHMTLYNLDCIPLRTLDFAQPDPNHLNYNGANKDVQKENGTVLCITKRDGVLTITVNRNYVNADGFGVELDHNPVFPLQANFPYKSAQQFCMEAWGKHRAKFNAMGIRTYRASKSYDAGEEYRGSLQQILAHEKKPLQKYFSKAPKSVVEEL